MKGTYGLIVVIVAILGTAFFGATIAAMTPEETEGIRYDYLTNITGLYTSEDVPIYSDYNPAANWNGYRSGNSAYTSGINYTIQERYNGIPVIQESGMTGIQVNLNSLGLSNEIPPDALSGYRAWYIEYGDVRVDNPSIASILRIYNAIESRLTNDASTYIRFDCSGVWGCYDYGWGFEVSPSVMYYTKPSAAYIDYYPDTDLAKVYNSGGTLIYAGSGEGLSAAIAWSGTGDSLATAISVYEVEEVTPVYIDIRNGISLPNTINTVMWSNGYENSEITMLFRPTVRGQNMTLTVPIVNDGTTDTVEIRIGKAMTGNDVIISSGSNTINMGAWSTVALTISPLTDTITAIGVLGFTDFQRYEYTNYAQSMELGASGTISSMQLYGSTMKFGIVNTKVFLDNYTLAFINPALNPMQHFPANDLYRVTYDSFALYGDSVTINDRTYEVIGSEVMAVWTVDGATGTGLIPLTGLSVETDGTETTIMWSNGRTLTEPTVSNVISFGGAWFFESDYYTGTEVSETVYDWEPLTWGLDKTQAIIVMLGFMAVGGFTVSRLKSLGWIDYAIMIIAFLTGWVIL